MPKLNILTDLLKGNPESLAAFRDMLFAQKDRMANPEAAYKAIDALRPSVPKEAWTVPATDYSVLNKILPGVAGGTIAASVLGGNPDNADAAMLPQVRQAYNAAREGALKTLFHKGTFVGDLMSNGITDPAAYGVAKEAHKPMGLYLTDKLEKIPGHVSGDYNNTDNLKELKNYLGDARLAKKRDANRYGTNDPNSVVRAVIPQNTRIAEMDEDALKNYKINWSKEWAKQNPDVSNFDKATRQQAYTQHWQDRADILKVNNVDNQPGLSEHILLNPTKASLFWENRLWDPEKGGQFFGPRKILPQFDRSRRVDKYADVVPQEHNAIDLESALNNLHDMSILRSTVHDLGPEGAPASLKELLRLQTMVQEDQLFNNFKKEITDVYSTSSSGWVKGNYIPGAIGAALGLGAYGAGEGDASAMPVGKWSKAKPTLDTLPRAEDAFYRLIGHKMDMPVNVIGDKVPVEIVDVVKNKKAGNYTVVAKDADGNRHQLPMTKDYLHAFTSAKGTKDYLERMPLQSNSENKYQALKSLGIREVKRDATEDVPDTLFKQFNAAGAAKVHEIDPTLVHNYTYVQNEAGQTLYMPKPYADLLSRKGFVKITGEAK